MATVLTAEDLVRELHQYIGWAVERNAGSTKANKPGHRLPFHWPPHPVSYSYHVLAHDWTAHASFEAHGETFEVEVAKTPYGVFGRSPTLWHDARGETVEEMLDNLRDRAEPYFRRQFSISKCLGLDTRFAGEIADLSPIELVKLLYCKDRDVANDGRSHIEVQASTRIFGPVLAEILRDRKHPDRRSAQWCVLDLFEDIASFFPTPEERVPAVRAIGNLLVDAEDDYARTIYKAGVVLGGQIPEEIGGDVLLECLKAPSRIGRRSAIHGLFHVAEWFPDRCEEVLGALQEASKSDEEPVLRSYARDMHDDIMHHNFDHISEPSFENEG